MTELSFSIELNFSLKIWSVFNFTIPGNTSFVRLYALFPSSVILITCSSSLVYVPTNLESIKSVKICLKIK